MSLDSSTAVCPAASVMHDLVVIRIHAQCSVYVYPERACAAPRSDYVYRLSLGGVSVWRRCDNTSDNNNNKSCLTFYGLWGAETMPLLVLGMCTRGSLSRSLHHIPYSG